MARASIARIQRIPLEDRNHFDLGPISANESRSNVADQPIDRTKPHEDDQVPKAQAVRPVHGRGGSISPKLERRFLERKLRERDNGCGNTLLTDWLRPNGSIVRVKRNEAGSS